MTKKRGADPVVIRAFIEPILPADSNKLRYNTVQFSNEGKKKGERLNGFPTRPILSSPLSLLRKKGKNFDRSIYEWQREYFGWY